MTKLQQAYDYIDNLQIAEFFAFVKPYASGDSVVMLSHLEKAFILGKTEVDFHEQLKSLSSLLLNEKQNLSSFENGRYIRPEEQFSCDRKEQVKEFEKLLSKDDNKVQYYVIHGEEHHHPYGLYKRINEKEIRFLLKDIRYIENPIHLNPDDDLEYFQLLFLRELFEIFKIDLTNYSNQKKNIQILLNSKLVQGYQCIALGIKLYSYEWKNNVPKLIKWLESDFCNCELGSNSPKFVFFFQINYEEVSSLNIFKKSFLSKIQDSLKTISKLKFLPKLDLVDRQDINIWLDIVSQNSEVKKEYLDKYFTQNKKYTMAFVEKQLTQIIKEHNSSILEQ